jgi:hypothetical protein
VPYDLRGAFLERVAAELHGKDLGDGLVHRVAYEVARSITWDAGRTAGGVLVIREQKTGTVEKEKGNGVQVSGCAPKHERLCTIYLSGCAPCLTAPWVVD